MNLQDFWTAFPGLDSRDPILNASLGALGIHKFDQGQILLTEGQVCQGVPWVLRGSIRVFQVSPQGREITLYRIEAGQSCLLSGTCTLEGGTFPAQAQCETPVEALVIPGGLHQQLLDQSPSWRRTVLAQMGRRLASVVQLVEEVAFRKMDQRLAALLLDRGRGTSLDLTHQEMAQQLGTSREVITRILRDMEEKGLIHTQRGTVEIRDVPGLLELEAPE